MKRTLLATSIALAAVLAVAPAVISCSGDSYSKISFSAQDTSYAVTSQGGSAVAYGNNIYFINGYRGYSDTNGTANLWGDVVKGALYRATLNGARDEENKLLFRPQADSEAIEFKYKKGTDYFDNEINIVSSTKIAPKTIGTEGYENGGLFIYDNYVYFASPNNEKNKAGTVQTISTDFFMMPLSGGKPTKIYTTTEKVTTSSSAYAFYKYNGSVYLVVNEDKDIVSVKINPSKEKVDDPVFFKVKATSVYFPVKETYYKGIDTNTPEDFIYFVRAVTDDDKQNAGTVIEAMRPDGSENFKVSQSGQAETIEAVRDGLLFYRSAEVGNTKLRYTNMHNMLMEYSKSYKKAQDAITDADAKNKEVTGTFMTTISSDFTATYAFRSDLNSNEVFFVGVTSSGMTLYRSGEDDFIMYQLCSNSGTPKFIKNNYLYFAGSSSDYYRVPLFKHMDGFGEAQLLAENTSTATFGCDYAAGYFTYYGEVDQWASGYAYFVKVDGMEGAEPIFVGQRASSDIPSASEIEKVLNGDAN
ncbi:MAG: hypothetical protein J1F71_05205 [Clostridiales bacterium]|nr:hypothetical protein [Clostridiales bacterium]